MHLEMSHIDFVAKDFNLGHVLFLFFVATDREGSKEKDL